MKFHIFVLLLIFVSCSSEPNLEKSNIQPSLEGVYISNGVEQFFLGSLPYWINYSSWAQCKRKEPIRYMNYSNLSKSYSLTYDQMIHIQHMWNRKVYAYMSSTKKQKIPLKDESFIFNNVYAQVVGGSTDFVAPKFKKISLVWIDSYLNNKKMLRKILRKDSILRGHPVILSHCLNSYEVEGLLQKLELDDLGAKIISAEMFSLYTSEFKPKFDFTIDVSLILKKKDITLFGKKNPNTILGINNFKALE